MPGDAEPIESCIREVERARSRVSRMTAKQITKADDRDYLKSVAYAWFRSHRPSVVPTIGEEAVEAVDQHFKTILDSTARLSAKITYLTALKGAKDALSALRSATIVVPRSTNVTTDSPPDFGSLGAGFFEVDVPILGGRAVERLEEDRLDVRFGVAHDPPPVRAERVFP